MAGMEPWEINLERQRDAMRDREKIAALESEIERLTCQLEKMHEAAPNCLFYQEQAEYWRGIAEDTTKQLVTVRRETIEECAKWLEDMPEHWRTLAVEMRRSLTDEQRGEP